MARDEGGRERSGGHALQLRGGRLSAVHSTLRQAGGSAAGAPTGAASLNGAGAGLSRGALLTLFGVALGVRLLTALLLAPLIFQRTGLSDGSDGYEQVARTVAMGAGYRFAPELGETMFLLPAYPLFLAGLFSIFGFVPAVAFVAQCILDALSAVMVSRLANLALGTRVGLMAGYLYALYAGAWIACSRFLTEPLYVFLTLAFIELFLAYLRCGAIGPLLGAAVSCGLCVLCKSVAGLLPIWLLGCVVILPAWRGQRLRVAGGLAVCLVVTALGVAPWVIRNHQLTGFYVYPSTSGGLALYTAHVYAANPGQRIRDSVHQAAHEVNELARSIGVRRDERDTYPRWFFSPQDELKVDQLAQQVARERIAANRSAFLAHIIGNVWRFWIGAPTTISMIVSIVLNLPLVLLALIGLLTTRWIQIPALALAVSVAAYLFLGHVAVLSVVRYSLTVAPVACILAAAPLARLLGIWLERRSQPGGIRA